MTILYDVSDLMSWSRPHLTGIQRTTVGILNGLVSTGVEPRLVRFDSHRRQFEPLDVARLPAAIRSHLPWARAQVATTPAGPAAAHGGRRRLSDRKPFFGTSPAGAGLRAAFREFKAAARQLHQHTTRWAAERFREQALPILPPTLRPGGRTAPVAAVPPDPSGPFAPGDVLLSLGASWPIDGHAEATASLRARGVCVLRMIYDLIPTIKPQWADEPAVRQATRWVRNVLTESDHVLTISEFSRGEIEKYCAESRFTLPPLSVVRLGDELGSGGDEPPPLPRFVPQRPFFVCVSTLDVRKNHRLLYDTWQVLAARDPAHCPDLLCLGMPHAFVTDLLWEMRQDRAVNGRIHLLEGIEDAELAWYYRHCAATIYPSRYEGWGLPVAESLGQGRLCLASNATSIPEISPGLPEFFHPLDALGLAALVERTLRDPEWVRAREAEIRARFVPTPWSRTAGQVRVAIEAAARSQLARATA